MRTSLPATALVALRNVVRQGYRTALAAAAVMFGVAAMVVTAGFVEWIFWGMREDTIRSRLGHLQVARAGWHEHGGADPAKYLLPARSPALDLIERTPGVVTVAPRLAFSGLASRGETTLGFIGEGIDAGRETRLSGAGTMTAGKALAAGDTGGVLLGDGLARNLGAAVGDTIVLLAGTARGGLNGVEVQVRGTFATATKAFDDAALRLPLETARTLTRSAGAHYWVVMLDDTDRTDAAAATLAAELGPQGFEVVPWHAAADFYRKTVRLFSRQVAVVELIIGIIIVLSISNTLLLAVRSRTAEIGTAMALGLRRREILAQFVVEGGLIGVAGAAAGVILGASLAGIVTAVGIPMPPPPGMAIALVGEVRVTPAILGEAAALGVGTTLAASLYPAWMASRLAIVDALRHGR
jgi:putative ABC transport system permease protein